MHPIGLAFAFRLNFTDFNQLFSFHALGIYRQRILRCSSAGSTD